MAQRLRQALRTWCQGLKIAGKLNLVLMLLLALVIANSLFVLCSLYVAYQGNESLNTLGKLEKQVAEMRLAQWRFRVSHERADALAARESLGGVRDLVGQLPQDVLVPAPGDSESVRALMDTFAARYREYLLYFEQKAALESGMHRASEDLLASMRALQNSAEPGHLAALVQSVLGARIVQQEFVITRDMNLAARMTESIDSIVAAATALRAGASRVETQIEAYGIGQKARLMGSTFGKLREYTSKSITNEESMNQAASALSEQLGKATRRQRDAISGKMILMISSSVAVSVLIVLLGWLLGRRFVKYITSPLTRLVHSSRELARGNYEQQIQQIELSSRDEIAELAASFSNMAHTVKQHIDTLRESEQQVRQRTGDLEVSNKLLELSMDAATALNESLEAKVLKRTAELEEANRKLSELTVTDALTSLANRRRFDEVFASEWARAGRSRHPLTVIMLDIDYFKMYNDRYGHPAGDECLRNVAHVLQTCARRAGDLLARYGGEEFVVVAADSDLATAKEFAETMRRSVELLAMPHEVSPVSGVVTVSIGIAVTVPSDNVQAARLLHLADDALYRAKNGGRNRVAE